MGVKNFHPKNTNQRATTLERNFQKILCRTHAPCNKCVKKENENELQSGRFPDLPLGGRGWFDTVGF